MTWQRLLVVLGAIGFLVLVALAAADERQRGDVGCRPNCDEVSR